jgi:DNA replication licensing factor MCM4
VSSTRRWSSRPFRFDFDLTLTWPRHHPSAHHLASPPPPQVAKAGIICTLNARTSILAAANPVQSKYNPAFAPPPYVFDLRPRRMSVVDNLNLPPTLLSRFDLIFLMLDVPSAHHDRLLARHVYDPPLRFRAPSYHPPPLISVSLFTATPIQRQEAVIPQGELTQVNPPPSFLSRKYISFARRNCHPTLTPAAADELVSGYIRMRRVGSSRKIISYAPPAPPFNFRLIPPPPLSATPRQLESLVRLAEARAKMRLSATVEVVDVAEAIQYPPPLLALLTPPPRLMTEATQQTAMDPATGLSQRLLALTTNRID